MSDFVDKHPLITAIMVAAAVLTTGLFLVIQDLRVREKCFWGEAGKLGYAEMENGKWQWTMPAKTGGTNANR